MIEQYLNTIHNTDCLEFMKQLPDSCVDLVFTDPPYKQEFHDRGMNLYRENYKKISDYGSSKDLDYEELFKEFERVCKKINFFIFCDKETKFEFIRMAKDRCYGYKEISFCKTSPTPFCNNQWLADVEYGLHIFKGIKVMGDYHTKRSFFIMTNFREKNIEHPTPKTVEVCKQILLNISEEGHIILDCFSGSGTAGIACIDLKRNYILIDKNKKFYADSCERIEKHSKQITLF